MNRLVELPPEQQTPEQKKVFEQLVAGRGRILGPYKILALGMKVHQVPIPPPA